MAHNRPQSGTFGNVSKLGEEFFLFLPHLPNFRASTL
jgi:hypothetical protein